MNDKFLIQDIDDIINIRQKYQAFKHGIRKNEERLTKTYKLLLKPVTKLFEKFQKPVKDSESRLTKNTSYRVSTG